MKHKFKNIFAIAIASCLLSFAIPLQDVLSNAQSSLTCDTFVMHNGASARIQKDVSELPDVDTESDIDIINNSGLRFTGEISQAEYDNLTNAGARFGVLIVAKDLLNQAYKINPELTTAEKAFTPEVVFDENSPFYFTNLSNSTDTKGKIPMVNIIAPECADVDNDGNVEIRGSLVGIELNHFTRSYVGVAYVAIPKKTAEGANDGYTYHFARYYGNDMANNTRCVYYIAQRALDDTETLTDEMNSALNKLYFEPFSQTSRFNDYLYAYNVYHHYIEHDSHIEGEGEAQHVIVYTHKETLYGELNSFVEAHPIIKPTTAFGGLTADEWNSMDEAEKAEFALQYNLSTELLGKFLNHHYIFDVDASKDEHTLTDARIGRVYAGGMQTFHLYYESSSTISEGHKKDTLAELLQHFLDVKNVEAHFGIKLDENGGDWHAEQLHTYDAEGNPIMNEHGEYVNHGIDFTGLSGNKTDELYITETFFDELRAYGVETITFTFATQRGGNKEGNVKYHIYQQENHNIPLPVYYTDANGKLTLIGNTDTSVDYITYPRVTIYLNDITPGGGLTFNPAPSMTSNTAEFAFLNVKFGLYHDAQNL